MKEKKNKVIFKKILFIIHIKNEVQQLQKELLIK